MSKDGLFDFRILLNSSLSMIKKTVLGVFVLVLVLAILPAALSSKAELVRSIEINSDVEKTHRYLVDLKNFASWSPFAAEDPTSTAEVFNEGVGSTFSWVGEKTGSGRMTIAEIVPNQTIKLGLEFTAPMEGTAKSEWHTEKISDTVTKVTWTFQQEFPYLKRYFGLLIAPMMGGPFDKGLQSLKFNVEALK